MSTSLPSLGLLDPSLCLGALTSYPWTTVARHFTALAFYGLAIAQWPSASLRIADSTVSYSLSTATFTLMFWCACFFHYMISAGRVDVDWSSGLFHARGWLVRSSRRTHRVMLVLAVAISAATVVQTSTVHSILATYSHGDTSSSEYLPDGSSTALNLLKADFVFSLLLSIYVGVRLSVEPTGLIRRRRDAPLQDSRLFLSEVVESGGSVPRSDGGRSGVVPKPKPERAPIDPSRCAVPEFAEECQICVQKVANRQLNCGHVICCCCILDMIKHSSDANLLCPFCRQPINSARSLRLTVSNSFVSLSECCSNVPEVSLV